MFGLRKQHFFRVQNMRKLLRTKKMRWSCWQVMHARVAGNRPRVVCDRIHAPLGRCSCITLSNSRQRAIRCLSFNIYTRGYTLSLVPAHLHIFSGLECLCRLFHAHPVSSSRSQVSFHLDDSTQKKNTLFTENDCDTDGSGDAGKGWNCLRPLALHKPSRPKTSAKTLFSGAPQRNCTSEVHFLINLLAL